MDVGLLLHCAQVYCIVLKFIALCSSLSHCAQVNEFYCVFSNNLVFGVGGGGGGGGGGWLGCINKRQWGLVICHWNRIGFEHEILSLGWIGD